jgi:putative acetyltransferase
MRVVIDATIRAERSEEADAITAVVTAAFGSPREGRLPAAIRSSTNFVPEWSLVAERGGRDDERSGRIVGHVMVSYITLADAGTERRVATLSPLSVAPDLHGRGIGSALVRAVLARVDDAGEPLVVLEGAPAYYGRFGFEPATPLGIQITLPDWAPPEAAQIVRLRNYDASIRGRIVYPPAFGALEQH